MCPLGASLHPNAGVLLRKEILLLPDHLAPTHSFDHGGNNGDDQNTAVSCNTNSPDDAGFDDSYTGEKLEQNDANMESNHSIPHVALEDRGARSGADPGARSHAESGTGSGADPPMQETANSGGGSQLATPPGPATTPTRHMQLQIPCDAAASPNSRGSHRLTATSPDPAGSPVHAEQRISPGPRCRHQAVGARALPAHTLIPALICMQGQALLRVQATIPVRIHWTDLVQPRDLLWLPDPLRKMLKMRI